MKIKPADSTEWYNINGDVTLRLNYPELNKDSIVVDIGARHGDWAIPIRNKYGCNIICFDVIKEFVDHLKNIGFTAYNFAILDKNNDQIFGVSDHEASIYHTDNTFIIKSIDTLDMFKLINSPNIDLLKMNIEGAEYDVIDNLIKYDLLKKISNLQVQFHQIENFENRYSRIFDILKQTHEISWKYPFIWENWKIKI
jgi:FkbM family methyltransferase